MGPGPGLVPGVLIGVTTKPLGKDRDWKEERERVRTKMNLLLKMNLPAK